MMRCRGLVIGLIFGAMAAAGCGDSGRQGQMPFGRVYRIGILSMVSDDHQKKTIASFLSGLEASGYSARSNLDIKNQDAGNSVKARDEILQAYVQWRADLILALSADCAIRAKEVSGDIPVVFSDVAYPVELGLVERLEFSSNQIAGVRSYVPMEEQLAFFMRLLPGEVRRIAVCLRTADPDSRLYLEEMRDLALKQGADVHRIESADVTGLTRALTDAGPGIDAFYLSCDSFMQGAGARAVIDFAGPRGIPVLSCGMSAVERGALAGAVVDEDLSGRLAASHAAQILAGRSPTSLLTLTASPPRLVVNRGASRVTGIRVPDNFMGEEVRIID